ncbi:putative adipose-regulatory protein-domain-containing protein [Suillus bovinus]|uniref:putative adipose-regulatory protein-domain-containing protein n=1 Tax=Suillus bovinus TaxID=48563 RepID=UPI001B8808A3|nr:putative adipose-regulatory protein-domain-containing protein [Suillus bovinus]KAG2159703.1 putative adipose-regulatory protein-domain-containing protein [Suillus bovinus]
MSAYAKSHVVTFPNKVPWCALRSTCMASSTPTAKVEPEDSKPFSPEEQHAEHSWLENAISSSIRFIMNLVRPVAPQLVPLLICLALIPVIIFFSLFSGWYIWKNVAVGWESPLYLQYGDGTSPYAEISLPSLVPSQLYDISIHLVIPASEANFALGNFMTTLTLSTPSNRTLASIRKPAIVLPPTKSRVWSSPKLVNLDVLFLESHAPGVSRAIARVELGRRDGWRALGNGEGRELTVFSASLRGTVKHHGIRGLVTRFPVTSSIVSSAIFLVISLLVLAACILPAIQWRFPSEDYGSGEPTEEVLKERIYRKRRQRRKLSPRNENSSPSEYKIEDVPIDMPSAVTFSDQPLRRRRSRASDTFYDSEP